ncbi:MAG: ribosome maturation factor RimM [Cyanobacteria bacterium P01_E01_bin.6]
MFDSDNWLEIGKIVAPQGLRGEMRVYPTTDFPERFLNPGERWLLREGSHDVESVTVTTGRFLEGKGLYVITLDGINHRDQAETLRNARLWVPESDRPPLDDGEFHVADLIGLQVYHHTTGQCIGHVKNILPAGNDILEIEKIPESGKLNPPSDIESDIKKDHKHHGNEAEQIQHNQSSRKKQKRQRKSSSKHQKKTVLVPFVYDIVPVVDLEKQRIEILPPPGLLNL